jgi:DNA-binding CsgD family transcriptional regulator
MTIDNTRRDLWTHDRALADMGRVALRAPDRVTFFDEAAERLKRAVHFDGACWHTLDPGSGLITQHHLQDIPDRFALLADNEYATNDVNKFTALAASNRPAATLLAATDGHPERSARHRDLLTPAGVGPELRAAFVVDGTAWGALIIVRRAGQPEFTEQDVTLLCEASSLLARAVRRGLVAEASHAPADLLDAPGVVEFDEFGDVTSASSSAGPLLVELSGSTFEDGVHSPAISAIVAATRAAVGVSSTERLTALPSSMVKCPSGSWLVLHGSVLHASRSKGSAVFIQRAHPMLVAPLLLKAYGLTAREQQVTQLVLRGATTAQIASRLAISPHTVSDHLKAIFDKTDARTRGELSATLFFGEHLSRIQARVDVGDDASFIDTPRPRGLPDP